ncbi:uncharacterized protein [Nothobranchius furzeri]|uniref:uncharacterized protein n=1 Tax=Nothobranchius furzeri TaxID=105023 RepID=UPI003904C722
MTKPKEAGTCPVCQKELMLISKHLKDFHQVKNIQERDILNKLAMERTLIPPGPCPIANCVPHLRHLEKHLDTHKELTQRGRREEKLTLKRKVALQLLKELRATGPQPPMFSTLDLDGDPAAGEGNTSANSACRTRVMYLTNEVYRLQGALADAKRELQQLRLQQPPEPQAQPLEPQAQPPEPQAQPLEPQAQPSEPQRSPQQPEVDTRGTKLKLTFSSASEELTETEAPVPKKKNKSEKSKRTKKAISPHTAHTFSDTEKSPKRKLSAMERAFQGLAPFFAGKSRASKLRNIPLGTSVEFYLEDYFTFIFCPEGTSKMQENAVSKLSRAKVFFKYLLLGSDSPASWNWEFLYNIPLLKS